MNKQILTLVIVAIILVSVSISLSLSQLYFFSSTEEKEVNVTVKDLMVNEKTENLVLSKEDSSVITATIINNSEDRTEEVTLKVKLDEEPLDDKHSWTYILQPGETKKIKEEKEIHHTWYNENFTIKLADHKVTVTVE